MYLDPGFGGMLIQIIVALIAAGGAIAFGMRRKIKVLFSKNKNKNTPPESSDAVKADVTDDADIVDMLSGEKDDEDDN
jgi:hypothetical protein